MKHFWVDLNKERKMMKTINKRMSDAQNQMQHFNEFDYLVINDDFNSALNDLNLIICRPDKDSERFSLSLSEQSKKHIKLLKKLI